MDRNRAALSEFVRMSATVGARCDYVQGGGGNASVKCEGRLVIKASGFRLEQVEMRAGYAVLDMRRLDDFFRHADPKSLEDVETAGAQAVRAAVLPVSGLSRLRPSVETGFHSLLDRYVLHTHCVWANIALCAPNAEAEIARALAGTGLDWCFVPYVNPGAALTFEVRRAVGDYERRHGRRPKLIFLENHGLIASDGSADAALELHERAALCMAAHYGLDMRAYPATPLRATGENEFESTCGYIRRRLACGGYGPRELLHTALYPDQLVFLRDNLAFRRPHEPADAACNIYPDGRIVYSCSYSEAEAIDKALTAVIFIYETLAAHGQMAMPLNEASQKFISGWEAEKARKRLMKG